MLYQKQIDECHTRIAELTEKGAIVSKWNGKLGLLSMDAVTLCENHAKVPAESFSRWVNGSQVPHKDSIAKVEAAFKKLIGAMAS